MHAANHVNRWINTFRKPYNSLLTPYKNDINVNVARYCRHISDGPSLQAGKVIFIGNSGVGKTSLIRRFCKNKYNSNSEETAGVDFESETFNIFGVQFNLEFWDTAGQERFKWITNSYYRGTNVIVVVFDLSEINSLYACGDWLDEAEFMNNNDFVFLVGNKLDAVSDQIHAGVKQIVSPIAKQLNAEYWAVSSKSGKNVKNLFLRIAFLTFESVVLKELADTEEKAHYENVPDAKINLNIAEEKTKDNEKHCTC